MPGVVAILLEDPASRLEHRDDRGLVVGAEDRVGGVSHDAVLPHDRFDSGLRGHRVRVRAQEDRGTSVAVRRRDAAVHVARVAFQAGGSVVLVPLEPEPCQVRRHAIRDRALAAGRARQRAELEEQVDQRRGQRLLHVPSIAAATTLDDDEAHR